MFRLCALPFLVTLLATSVADADHPNVVLILADDLGYGDVGCYNPGSKIPTPHIDRLAAEGTRFTDAHAPASVCVPTRYSLLTGRYSHRRPNRNGGFDAGPLIGSDVLTLPAMLRQAGYRTAMVGKWHLGFAFDGWERPLDGGPIDRGFESYFGVPASTDIPPYFYIEGDRAVAAPTETIDEHHSDGVRPIQGAFWRAGGIAPGLRLEDVLPTFADKALGELDARAQSKEPFFLYLALTAPHTPWLPAEPYRGRSRIGGEAQRGATGGLSTRASESRDACAGTQSAPHRLKTENRRLKTHSAHHTAAGAVFGAGGSFGATHFPLRADLYIASITAERYAASRAVTSGC
ncbi:MAG TPA: sulfatase-like hydrolase/transferase, partial [Planctomycetaceae bacterium]